MVAKLGDAHPPRVNQLGDLGYMATDYKASTGRYAALVVKWGAKQIEDRWELAVVDAKASAGKLVPLLPRDLAGAWSVEGFGLV